MQGGSAPKSRGNGEVPCSTRDATAITRQIAFRRQKTVIPDIAIFFFLSRLVGIRWLHSLARQDEAINALLASGLELQQAGTYGSDAE
jgi:hypothetical protein